MGWLDVLNVGLGVANVAVNVSNASKLEQLQAQGAAAALIQAVITELRDQIFKFKQAAEAILASEAQSTKVAAGAMQLLELRLQDSGINPDLFRELSDKEYAASTIRLIRDNSSRLLGQLPDAERGEVTRVAAIASHLPKYNYYLANYSEGKRLQEAAYTVAEYAPRNSCLVQIGLVLYVYPGIGIPIGVMISLFGNSLGIILGLAVWVAGLVAIMRWMNARGYRQAKKLLDDSKNKLDLEQFNALDRELGGEDKTRRSQAEAQRLVQDFFGSSQLLAS
jgi:hypothetical protein